MIENWVASSESLRSIALGTSKCYASPPPALFSENPPPPPPPSVLTLPVLVDSRKVEVKKGNLDQRQACSVVVGTSFLNILN
ncbi:hypothetical protein TNCV_1826491 [Trichonephila clavipes]|nr:hypothetical protein TNCV_1826491 [Trichonephila clavipes]